MNGQPSFVIDDQLIVVRLVNTHDQDQEVNFDCIVDLTLDNEIVGFEILDIRRQLRGATVTPTRVSDTFGWSYDPEVDATYFRLQGGRGLVQIKKRGIAILSATGDLVELKVPVERPRRSG
jgi:uncharacterized protein YuzE